jgi:hypothetical protein
LVTKVFTQVLANLNKAGSVHEKPQAVHSITRRDGARRA